MRDAEVVIVRLRPGDLERARQTFATLEEVFMTGGEGLGDDHVERLLADERFRAFAALDAVTGAVVGGVTAHVLPMTRAASTELFVYDLAVRPQWQRRGVGRQLVEVLVRAAAEEGIGTAFVLADDDDAHAVAFYDSIGGRASAVTMFDLDPGSSD